MARPGRLNSARPVHTPANDLSNHIICGVKMKPEGTVVHEEGFATNGWISGDEKIRLACNSIQTDRIQIA
jgi:hypothetical protein